MSEIIRSSLSHLFSCCHCLYSARSYSPEELQLTGDYGFGSRESFAHHARMAVRLANFISAFLQVSLQSLKWHSPSLCFTSTCFVCKVSDPKEVYSEKRVADKPLTEDQMIAETLSIVAGDLRIFSAGTYWDTNKFTNRTLFAPYAYSTTINNERANRKFKVEDLARNNKEGKSQVVLRFLVTVSL